jgi:hypothetical protein
MTLKRQIGAVDSRHAAFYRQQFIDSKTAGLVKVHLPQGMNLSRFRKLLGKVGLNLGTIPAEGFKHR